MKKILGATKNNVVGRLVMKGLNLKEFAKQNGFNPHTVPKIVSRFVGTGRVPQGAIATEILNRLEKLLYK